MCWQWSTAPNSTAFSEIICHTIYHHKMKNYFDHVLYIWYVVTCYQLPDRIRWGTTSNHYFYTSCPWPRLFICLDEFLFEASKHEWYNVVINCMGHVFSTSLLNKSSQKLSKKPNVDFRVNYYMGPSEGWLLDINKVGRYLKNGFSCTPLNTHCTVMYIMIHDFNHMPIYF